MRERTAQVAVGAVVFMIVSLLVPCLRAQETEGTLSGTVTDSSRAALANVQISVKNLATGQSAETQTDTAGTYKVQKLAPGEYEVSVSAEGFAAKTEKVTIAAGTPLTFNAVLTALPSAPQVQPQAPANNAPNAPPGNKPPSLEDLGFSPTETKSNAKEQALLDKRTHMLKIHQRLGLITTIPMIASVATSINAGGRNTNNTDRTVHMVLGSATADLYFMTAWYAIRAPRVEGSKSRGPIRFHKAMAWIHGPGMILTPILGAMAYSQKNNGERVHGIAKAHGPVAIVTAGAFGAALLSVSLKF
ncbi:MAG TPA: carboxypeptidase-like regulatory domain-containing protein [Candidatus Acidoferrum sp.]